MLIPPFLTESKSRGLGVVFEAIDNPKAVCNYVYDVKRSRGYFDPLGLSPDGLNRLIF